jgi:hypothetical protein
MSNQHYTTTFTVDQTPDEAFNAINNIRGWWSQEIDGDTDQPGAVFNYHYQDIHRATLKITEFVPGKKVVWHVVDNYFNFIKDKNEWIDTDIVFEVAPKGDKTEVHFTHVGLVPDYECYDICTNAWGTYVTRSLRDLITTGKGQPNPIEEIVDQARKMVAVEPNYTTAFMVSQSPEAVFAAVNNVLGWWSDNIEGDTDRLGAEFEFHADDTHHSTQKITEFVPNQKVVWHVTDSKINFVKDTAEWTNTEIIFDITPKDNGTELRFTHVGLIPAIECYNDCSGAWFFYVNVSLSNLIITGKGQPTLKEKGEVETAS